MVVSSTIVIPAKAGTHCSSAQAVEKWAPGLRRSDKEQGDDTSRMRVSFVVRDRECSAGSELFWRSLGFVAEARNGHTHVAE